MLTICHFPWVSIFPVYMGPLPISHSNLARVIHCVPNFFFPPKWWLFFLSCTEVTPVLTVPLCEWQDADLLSHRRDQEGRQNRSLRVVLAFLLHPEVQSHPGSLVDPRGFQHKPQNAMKPSLTHCFRLKLHVLVQKCLIKKKTTNTWILLLFNHECIFNPTNKSMPHRALLNYNNKKIVSTNVTRSLQVLLWVQPLL